MAKGRRNSQRKKKNSKGNEEFDDENGDEGAKKCPHISRAVKLSNLQNKVPHTNLGQCVDCGELDSSAEMGVCICLCCAYQGCDRNSEEKHALLHNRSSPAHNIVIHLQNWGVWCYACDDEVPFEQESVIHNCVKLLLKSMNLNPPPEPEVCLSSSNKTAADKPRKGDFKKNSMIRSRIKGLVNLGNTCFFNAVMQFTLPYSKTKEDKIEPQQFTLPTFPMTFHNLCQTELLHIAASCTAKEGFSQQISPSNRDLPHLTVTVQEAPGPVTKALWKLLQDFRHSSDATLNPKQLFGEICKKATRFKGFRQQDSQELLRYLLDSIRNEEIRRVKVAVLKSFGVASGNDVKGVDDDKRAQVKEYGACAEAPLIDSVFAGRLVSIVICCQCHQEFKVEETFLDLSLPLTAPQQDSWNFKPFADGKQNPKSNKSFKSTNETTTTVKNDYTETEPEGKVKSPSKHQQKAARKAERKKSKKGKGHGKAGKGKASPRAMNSNKANKEDDKEGEKERESEELDSELDQVNESDVEGSNDEQESNLNKETDHHNATEEQVNGAGDRRREETPDNDAYAQDENNCSRNSRESDGSCNTDFSEGDKRERGGDSPDVEGEGLSMDISNDEQKEMISSQTNSENFETNAADLSTGHDSSANHSVIQLSPTITSDAPNEEKPGKHSHNEPKVSKAGESGGSVLLSTTEIVERMDKLTLNADLEKELDDFQLDGASTDSSVNCLIRTMGDASLSLDRNEISQENFARVDENLAPKECLPGGNSETAVTSANGKDSSRSRPSNEEETGTTESQANENVKDLLNSDQDVKQEIEITENREAWSDSSLGNETKETLNKAAKSESISEENESDSDEQLEPDSQGNRGLTLQPAYHPSPGECSVMSCLSQFCAAELLDGSNKFACEECSRRVQQSKKTNGPGTAGEQRNSDDSEDDECAGAKAPKNKECKQQTVYTVATKQLLISLAPPVLTLHLKRFQQARFTLRKLTKHVDFPLELNLAPFCSRSGRSRADSEGRVLYSLYGIVQHSGNMNSGHYTAYVKVSEMPVKGLYDRITSVNELTDFIRNMWTGGTETTQCNSRCLHEPVQDGQWFHISDSSVSAVPETRVLKSQAYMLFYGRLPLSNR